MTPRGGKGRRRRDCDNEGLEGLTVEETCPAWDQHHLCDALGTTMTMDNNNISVGGNVNSDDNGNGGNSNDEIDSNDRVETKDTVGGGAAAAAARGGSCSSGELLGEVDVEGEQEGGGSDEDNKEEGTGDDSIEEEADDAAERGGNDLEEEDSAILSESIPAELKAFGIRYPGLHYIQGMHAPMGGYCRQCEPKENAEVPEDMFHSAQDWKF